MQSKLMFYVKSTPITDKSSGTNIVLLTRDPIFIFQQVKEAIDEKEKEKFEGLVKNLREHLPSGFKIGAAVGAGDCFFDSVAQRLNELKNSKIFSVKSLREDCVNSANKYRDEIIKDAGGGGYFLPQKNIAFSDLGNIKDEKGNDVPDVKKTFNRYLESIRKTAEEGDYPIWGRPEIEGKIICEKYKVKIKVIELRDEGIGEDKLYVTTGEVGEGDDIVYIVNYRNHFVPLLSKIEKDIESNVEVYREEVYDVVDQNSPSLLEDIGNYDFEEQTQVIQNKEKINPEILELIEKKHSKSSDDRQPKSGQKQKLQLGPSHQVDSLREQPSSLSKNRKKRSNNGLGQSGILEIQQVSQELLSSDEEYCDASDKVERSSISCESDSDLESIPTVSHFKQRTWKDCKSGKVGQSSFNENKGTRKSFGENGYIEGQWKNNHLIELDSCQFTHPHNNKTVYIRKQSPGYLFTFDQENFIARVSFNKIEELDFVGYPIDIKRNFLEKLKITKIIEDELLNNRDKAYEQFKQFLQDRSGKTADNLEYAEDLFQFSKRLEDWRKFSSNISILDDIVGNKNISQKTIDSSQQLLTRERALDVRKKEFSQVDQFYTRDLLTGLQQICKEGINNHRKTLHDKYFVSIFVMAPSVMADHLPRLNDKSIFYISNKDIKLFADLIDIMNKQPFLDFIGNSWDILFKNVEEIRQHESVGNFAPLTNPIYFYLCKSFKELSSEISSKTDIPVSDLLKKNEQGKWGLIKTINWPSTSSLNHSLEQQYRFIFTLMKHFEPGYYSNKKKFENDKTLWQFIKSLFVSSDELSATPEERLVWIYILNNAIVNLLSKEELKSFEPLIQGYMDFIKNTEGDHYESFRIATHNVIRFIAQTSPYLSKEISVIDQTILTKQIESIKKAFLDKQSGDFRDLVDVYNEYWKNRESILEKIPDKFPYGKFKQDMEAIRNTLLDIASTALDKKAKSQGFIKYFRSFNEFLEDLNSIEFNWFIQEANDLTEVEVANKDKNSYKVLDSENFIKKYKNNIPNHYLIEITQDLLNRVSNLLRQKKWSDDDNLSAASELLSAVKKSFLYLKEQPNYVSFATFKKESTEPFISVVDNSSSYKDFKKRIGIIGESFWYLRKQDEIDIDKALELYRKENNNSTVEALRDCYNRYLKEFNSYIQEASDKNYQDKIKFITEKVRKQSKQIKTNEWNTKFKRETLPDLLAGLAAVWSIQQSKDITSTGSTGKSLKPHCIQILCILRLLSVDKDSKGVDKHLAQVLTGQGKSLVLGLLSSLLVLTGHKVRTVCYSEYLATRDQQDFNGFFKEFGIGDKITYGTFEEMANEVINPEVNGKKQGLRELVEGLILNHSAEQSGQIKQEDISNTILLIDEVDVFFSDQFYGNTYGACNTIGIPGLASIQEEIWEMASKSYEKSTILEKVEEFIKKKIGERNQDFKEFNKFLFKPGKYYLLKEKDNVVIKKEYTNRSLYQEHLEKMIDAAIKVAKGSDEYINNYKINDKGIISYRKDDGFYSIFTYCGYYNIFHYFRLKNKDFDRKNYGYLNISCGKISYAKLPEKYPLILGVSGTLTTLNDHEKKAVRESYNIRENSIMPSFFGDSHLKFNSSENFTSQNSEEEWLSKIFNRANSKVDSEQSVLIFFDTDVEIRKFKEKFFGKFYRLHILTENTEEHTKEKYIDGAGIAKTVTLATRGMGRGVDFKSSVAVENRGGVHVIQTFFSLDIKEETQIKGRTARKDNKGSYELILCKEHLVNAGFLKEEEKEITINYESLNKSREQKVKEKGSNNEKRIRESESNHKTTMDFLESFFQKECSTNIDQPSVEPAVSRQQNR
ncbi:OTU domain-containing protein [Wolbachia endosymbiont (group B) of Chorthippus parallelus]|uniref:hypothetical protein n=1 Tax=Wolbachia endosymbiont (group B) of Chorthippus parallelus TaxID=2953997 RepID=UPI00223219DB|nr:hypothetical protein [Wolbachia endosymbiont (group B) of Chorthippus parallelus]